MEPHEVRAKLRVSGRIGLGETAELVSRGMDGGEDLARLELVAALEDEQVAVRERAARALKKIAEIDGTVLMKLRKPLLQAAFEAKDVRVQGNLTIVLGKLPLRRQERALAIEQMYDRLQREAVPVSS